MSLPTISVPGPNRKALDAGAPCITLAGVRWPVPLLAPRQNRIVVPVLMRLGPEPERHYDGLVDLAYAALTRAHPGITREQFEDWPLPLHELVEAIPVVSERTGLLRPAKAAAAAKGNSEPPDWDAIIAQFCNFLPGTTPDYWEDALTWPRLESMYAQWEKHPPAAVLLAGRYGYKPKPKGIDAIQELMSLFPDGRIAGSPTLH